MNTRPYPIHTAFKQQLHKSPDLRIFATSSHDESRRFVATSDIGEVLTLGQEKIVPTTLRRTVICCVLLLVSLLAVPGRSAIAQILNWSSPTEYSPIQVGGQSGRGGVGAAVFNGKLYIAYTDNLSNGNLWLTYQTSPTTYAVPVLVTVPSSQNVQSAMNPSLAVYNNRLWIVWVSSQVLNYTSTADGINFNLGTHWAPVGSCGIGGILLDSPNLTTFGSKLYIGFRTTSSTLGICTLTSTDPTLTDLAISTTDYPNFSLGESPGLGVFNGNLFVAYKDTSGSNYIYLAQSYNGVNFSLNTGATGSHTSSAPSIAVYNGVLYIGFRQNSSGDRFYYTYSLDGVNFSGPIEVHWTMGGPPALIVGPDLKLYNIFRQNDSGHYLFTASTY